MYLVIAGIIIFLLLIFIIYFYSRKSSILNNKSKASNSISRVSKDLNNSSTQENCGKVFTENELNSLIAPRHSQDILKYSIPNTYSILDSNTLKFCTILTELYINEDMFFIQDKSFVYCDSLININVHEDNKNYSSKVGVLFSKDFREIIFYPQCKQSSTYFIPQGVEVIRSHAFTSNKHIKYVVIPNSVTHIDKNAFINCKSLKQIVIPDSLEVIDPRAFSICPLLSLRGYKNSFSESYCKQYFIPFEYLNEK